MTSFLGSRARLKVAKASFLFFRFVRNGCCPAPHPFGLRVDNRLSTFLQAREQMLISLRASFNERPKVLDEMEAALPELLLGLYPTQEQDLSLLHVLAEIGWAA